MRTKNKRYVKSQKKHKQNNKKRLHINSDNPNEITDGKDESN